MWNGKWVKVLFKVFVLGDIIKFFSGDCIGVDVCFVEVLSLYIEEFVLIGEFVFV